METIHVNTYTATPETDKKTSMTTSSHSGNTDILTAAQDATRRIAPLWPLKHFVAVNPFLGLTEQHFIDAAQVMARTAGARMTMPRSFYAEAIASGRITEADLTAALADTGSAATLPKDHAALTMLAQQAEPDRPDIIATVADVVTRVTERDWVGLVTQRLSNWAASYFDEGQVAWRSPWRDLSPYAAWRAETLIDRTPELMGLSGFRQIVAGLPETADDMLIEGASRLGLDDAGLELWFHRLLMSIGGWASYARYRVWESELNGGSDTTLVELLAIRLAWDTALLEAQGHDPNVLAAWTQARDSLSKSMMGEESAFAVDGVLQLAYEKAWQRTLLDKLSDPATQDDLQRHAVQAVFCIDVRSEVFRRAFEGVSSTIETHGFAGFFGFPIEYVPLGHERGGAQCPVLLTPKFTVCETVQAAGENEEKALLGLRLIRRRTANAWKSFKMAAVSSFAFVETMGWTYLGKLAIDAFGLTRPVPHPAIDGIDANIQTRLGPRIDSREIDGRHTGFSDETRLDMATAVLKAMSMQQGFARLVLLAGHGSTTVNNPHATGLDCGACGGHTGEANARVAAAILNDPKVRAGLLGRGIAIPEDTAFLGCLHDTTTDEVTIFDEQAAPASHAQDLIRLKKWLKMAAQRARAERAVLFNLDENAETDRQVIARSRDWSQVRPEWGLAGCAAFIAAPRSRTARCDLGGRAFLHSYDWRQDEDFSVLELIMTAPMVVASWISLQYYGSTVDNRAFGSGNKVLHNVVGTLGVFEGNGGDLRVGLPWQSVQDGTRLIHEPLRLSVCIAAPSEAINAVIAKHDSVRQLVDNGWLHLFALGDPGDAISRYTGSLTWKTT